MLKAVPLFDLRIVLKNTCFNQAKLPFTRWSKFSDF